MMDCAAMQQETLPLVPVGEPDACSLVQCAQLRVLGELWHVTLHGAPMPGRGSTKVSYFVDLDQRHKRVEATDPDCDFMFLDGIEPEQAVDADQVGAVARRAIEVHLAKPVGCCSYWLRKPHTFPFDAFPEPGQTGRYMPELLRYWHDYVRQKENRS